MKKPAPSRKNYGKSTRTFIFMTVAVFIAAGVYGFLQYQKLTVVQTAIANGQTQLRALQVSEKQISADYSAIKKVYDENFQTIRESIEAVYPAEEQLTELTRLLDDYVTKNNHTTLNPIFMSDISFSRARNDEENGYTVLPFTLTLSTSRDNFEKFLAFVENSGSLDEGIRLMDIQNISIGFPSQEVSAFGATTQTEIPLMNVSMSLNAYFQPSPST